MPIPRRYPVPLFLALATALVLAEWLVVPSQTFEAKAPDLLVGPVLVQPNMLITFRKPIQFDGMYSFKRTVTRVAVLVDKTISRSLLVAP